MDKEYKAKIRDMFSGTRQTIKDMEFDEKFKKKFNQTQNDNIYNNWAATRRAGAVINCLDEILTHQNKNRPDILVERFIDDFLVMPYPGDLYFANSENRYLTTVALWILDQLSFEEKLDRLKQFLPDDTDGINAIELSDFEHPSYDRFLIRALVYVLKYRNKGLINESGINNGIIEQKKEINTGKLKEEYPLRYSYESIISLLDQDTVKKAVGEYRRDVFRFMNLYIDAYELLWKDFPDFIAGDSHDDLKQLVSRESISSIVRDIRENIGKGGTLKDDSILKRRMMPLVCLTYNFNCSILSDENRYLDFERTGFSDRRKEKIISLRDKILDMDVRDPYDTAFAVFYQFDNDDDWVWLINVTFFLLKTALSQTPDYYLKYSKTGNVALKTETSVYDRIYDKFTWMSDADSAMTEEEFKETMENLSFDILRTSLEIRREEQDDETDGEYEYLFEDDFEEDDELGELYTKENFVQKLYSYTGIMFPRIASMCDKNSYDDFIDSIDDDESVDKKQLLVLLLHMMNAREKQFYELLSDTYANYNDDSDINLEEDIEQYKEKVREQKKQINNLKQLLHGETKKLSQIREKYENSHSEEELLRQELADLREIVFIMNSGSGDQSESPAGISFPYPVKDRKIVSFGGFSNWINSMKKYLPDVKFISPDVIPNIELIRHAEEIWIQTNCISHSTFYRIVNAAGENKKRIHYYKYQSAQKCAEQIVGE